MDNYKLWVVLSIITCLLWNAAAVGQAGGNVIVITMVAYFSCLYMLTKAKNINPWLTFFGILNILGIVVIMFANENNWGRKP
jgi:hypothetical protein